MVDYKCEFLMTDGDGMNYPIISFCSHLCNPENIVGNCRTEICPLSNSKPPRVVPNIARKVYMLLAYSNCKKRQVGAGIFHVNGQLESIGYNFNISGECEEFDNPTKTLSDTLHAEVAAINNSKGDLDNHIMYVTYPPCSNCSAQIKAKNLQVIVLPEILEKSLYKRCIKQDLYIDVLSTISDTRLSHIMKTGELYTSYDLLKSESTATQFNNWLRLND